MRLFTVLGLFIIFSSASVLAQNIQLHYDFGENRKHATSTIEMFNPDKLGNTFFFVDMDYNANDIEGVSLSYFELARVFKTDKMPVGVHVEYNGGFGQFKAGNDQMSYNINDAWLAGIDYSMNASDFSKGLTLKALYKNIRNKHDATFQLTAVWYVHFLDRKFTFSGFADFWKEDSDFDYDGTVDADFIFIAEPQIWYNINKQFSVGSEIELTNNFAGQEGFVVNPTLAIKWNIK